MTQLFKVSRLFAALAVALCATFVIDARPAMAQVACPVGNIVNAGLPTINGDHVFCGEISGNVKGFHSRPGGINPANAGIANVVVTAAPNAMGIYNISFDKNGHHKTISTMFPDSCTQQEVENSILYAEANRVTCPIGAQGWASCGMNRPDPVLPTQGPYCEGDDDTNRFYVQFGLLGNGTINTAFPLR
jgi:hypothetical protein